MPELNTAPLTADSPLAPLYGAARSLLAREGRWRAALAGQIGPEPHDVILDIGCGAGALSMLLARMQPRAVVIGMDPRGAAIAQARARAAEVHSRAAFIACEAQDAGLHLGARTPTKIVLTLTGARGVTEKIAHMQCARQIIDPAGALHVVDYGAQRTALMQRLSALAGRQAGEGDTRALIRAAGFVAVEETATWSTASGALSLYRARAS
ncbi:MAG: methyltransferase domain-containing protein [Hyphomonadaceae bacterium]|nr:methyltransferase domain-containing protein [Hyphomonadaceae bacterium]